MSGSGEARDCWSVLEGMAAVRFSLGCARTFEELAEVLLTGMGMETPSPGQRKEIVEYLAPPPPGTRGIPR